MSTSKTLFRSATTLTIQEVSKRLNIAPPTLRFWEKELGGVIVPLRTAGGQRRYTPKHLFLIDEIKRLRQKGLSLLDIKMRLGKGTTHFQDRRISVHIDVLANQIAQLVKLEIHRFLQEQNLD
jgi:DNA-binding transcriptional MerR regulator